MTLFAALGRIKDRRPLNGLDSFRAGRQHNQAVEAKRGAACVRHIGKGCEEVLIERIGGAKNSLLFLHGGDESPPLFARITQFVESIGQFNAATI